MQATILPDVAEARSEVTRLEAKLSKSTAWGRPEADVEWERIPEFDGIDGYDAFGFRIGVPLHLGKTGMNWGVLPSTCAPARPQPRSNQWFPIIRRQFAAEQLRRLEHTGN